MKKIFNIFMKIVYIFLYCIFVVVSLFVKGLEVLYKIEAKIIAFCTRHIMKIKDSIYYKITGHNDTYNDIPDLNQSFNDEND